MYQPYCLLLEEVNPSRANFNNWVESLSKLQSQLKFRVISISLLFAVSLANYTDNLTNM